MKIPLTYKILAGHFLLLAIIGGMAAILLLEQRRMREIDTEMKDLQSVQGDINAAHCSITELALLGESILGWKEADITLYRQKRLITDSLLQILKPRCRDYVHPDQIDTLRQLMANKETLLLRIVEALGQQETADSLLNHLPEVAERATRIRTVKQKRNNLFGALGSKKTVRILPSAKELHIFSDSLLALQREGTTEMGCNADSLYIHNLLLNARLNQLVGTLNSQASQSLQERERKISEAHALSLRLSSSALIAAILLLVLGHLVIHREIRWNIREKEQNEKLIGELQESDKRNKKLLQFRRNILQAITHELRTLLTAISGSAELLQQDAEGTDKQRHIRTIRESAGRMASMTDELLEFLRLDSQKEKLHIQPFQSASIAPTLETEFMPLAEAKGLVLITDNRADEVLSGDKERILRIGSNLLSNAVKFTHAGHIILSTEYSDGLFTLSVQDTGTGIPKEMQEQIFSPFERLGNAVTQDGFGLGLAILTDLVKLMNGSISVESEPDKGSRFTVSLPLPRAEEALPEEKKKDVYPSLAGCSVLAIDNDPVTLRLMWKMYLRNGVECDTCLTLAELTDKIRGKDYDLLVTDLKMPEANGYEVLELLRTSEIGNSKTVPVVVVTAAGHVTEEEMKEAGFAALLHKPFSIDELMEATQCCIGRKGHPVPDFSPLLAFGDKRNTLQQLMAEMEKDMAEVRKALEMNDTGALNGWIHHLRSSWMIIRAEQPLQELYEALHKEPCSASEIRRAVRAVLEQGAIIMEMAGKEMKKWEK